MKIRITGGLITPNYGDDSICRIDSVVEVAANEVNDPRYINIGKSRDWLKFSDAVNNHARCYVYAKITDSDVSAATGHPIEVPPAFNSPEIIWGVYGIPRPTFKYFCHEPVAVNKGTRGNLPPEANNWWGS